MVAAIRGLIHDRPGTLAWDVHLATATAPVRKRPGYADGAYGVHPVRVLDYLPLERIGDDRICPFERHLGDYTDDPLLHLGGDALGFHETPRVGIPVVAEKLHVVGVVQQCGQPHHVHVPALLEADRKREVVHPDGVPYVMTAAVALEETPDEIPGMREDQLIHTL